MERESGLGKRKTRREEKMPKLDGKGGEQPDPHDLSLSSFYDQK